VTARGDAARREGSGELLPRPIVAPRTLRIVVGDDEHVYDIDADGHPHER
jgi:hypothetical protein